MPKDIRFISKRRKIRSRIQFYSIDNSGNAENTCALKNEISSNLENNTAVTSIPLIEDYLTCNFSMDVSSNLIEPIKTTDNESIEKNMNFSDTNLDLIEVNNELRTSDESTSNLRDRLFLWVIQENITQKSVNSLLQILHDCGHDTLPRDARTLMHTPKYATREIKKIAGGSYIHFGVVDGLLRSIAKYFKVCPNTIDILINVDDLSISNSSSSQF